MASRPKGTAATYVKICPDNEPVSIPLGGTDQGAVLVLIGSNPITCALVDRHGDVASTWLSKYDLRNARNFFERSGLHPNGLGPFSWLRVLSFLPLVEHAGAIARVSKFFFRILHDEPSNRLMAPSQQAEQHRRPAKRRRKNLQLKSWCKISQDHFDGISLNCKPEELAQAFKKHDPCHRFTVVSDSLNKQHTMRIRDFINYMEREGDREGERGDDDGHRSDDEDPNPLYLFDSKVPKVLRDGLQTPELFREIDVLQEVPPPQSIARCKEYVLLGGRGSGTGFHVDPFSLSAWSALATGCKHWAFYPPESVPPGVKIVPPPAQEQVGGTEKAPMVTLRYHAPSSRFWFHSILPGLEEKDTPLYFEQMPGDIVFIPAGWWHCVMNAKPSLAYTQNVLTRNNIRAHWRQIHGAEPGYAALLRAYLNDAHT
eukprot:jgi/Bigna1/89801/estExt_fgenesh1_pg.C_550139